MSCQSRFDARYWMLGAGALGRPRGMVWGGRREEGSGWGTHVYLWQIHFDIWQNQYNIVKFKKKIFIFLLHSPTFHDFDVLFYIVMFILLLFIVIIITFQKTLLIHVLTYLSDLLSSYDFLFPIDSYLFLI